MSGRGDNNKRGSSGRGSSNQSNQGAAGDKTTKSNHGKQTGGQPSKPQKKTKDGSVERNMNSDQE
jgi:hypothetical protein